MGDFNRPQIWIKNEKKLKKLLTSDFVCDKINKSSKDDTKYADVAELADALDLGSSVARRECSSHFIRTINAPRIKESLVLGAFYFC